MFHYPKKSVFAKTSPGFALIATIAVMVLLVMVALAMMSLSSIELRQSGYDQYQREAQANARMALMLAIGELQKAAGPDQRITAEASILEEAVDDPTPLSNRHWVGVWRSDAFKGDPTVGAQPIIYRNADSSGAQAGSLLDRRAVEGDYDKKTQALTWLVSQQINTSIDPEISLPEDANSIKLVGPGSTSENSEEVMVPRVKVFNLGKESGGYAWWVGDEGVKSRANLSGVAEALNPPQPWLSPAQAGIGIIPGYENYESQDSAAIEKMLSYRTSELSPISATPKKTRLENFHDLSFSSVGLLTDTFKGGLRRDLSAFLATGTAADLSVGGVTRKGLTATTPILDSEKLRVISPQFGLFYQWSELAQKNISAKSAIDVIATTNVDSGVTWSYHSQGDLHPESGIDLSHQDTPPMHPILIDAGVSYGASLIKKRGPDADGKTTYKCNLHYFPRAVLWNPYNVKLSAASYAVQMFMPHKGRLHIVSKNGSRSLSISPGSLRTAPNPIVKPIFSIPATSFEPGEALLFTADAGTAKNGNNFWGNYPNNTNSKLSNFRLSCTQSSPLIGNFYFTLVGEFKLDADEIQDLAYKIEAQQDGVWKHYFYKLFLAKGGDDITQVTTDISNFPQLQYIMQTEDGSKGSDAPWFVGIPASATAPLRDFKGPPVHTYYRFKWGHRMQWLEDTVENQNIRPGKYNTPYLGYNVLANHNIRAGWHVRSPCEVAFRASASAGRYVHGILIDDPYGWDWFDNSLSPVPVKGKNRVSPFGRSADFGGQTFPILDVPRKDVPLTSMASLQHAPLSQFAWHPTNAVGNSLADPRVPRTQSTHFVDPSQWSSIGIHYPNPDRWFRIRQAHINSNLNDAAFLYDLSYETNMALWDAYYFSTVPESGYSLGDALANPRLALSTQSGTPQTSDLQDFHQSAKYLQIKGAFNVNSTSEKAWSALIASLRESPEMSITLHDGKTIKANDVYSRFLNPYDVKYDGADSTDESMWKGYRQLTDAQIRELANEIVKEVKQRGPFISLADFVNRRLVEPPSSSGSETSHSSTGLKGALQTAIDHTSINTKHLNQHIIDKSEYKMGEGGRWEQIEYGSSYPEITYPLKSGNHGFGSKPDHNHWADSKLVGAPSFLTQADMLQKWGSMLSARSDTFTIRAYGDAKDTRGNIKAKAWCEAVVQRIAEPMVPDAANLDSEPDIIAHPAAAFGRKFKIISFRWLNQNEI